VIDSTKTDKNGYYSFTYKYKGKYDGSSFDLRANASDSYYKRGRFETIGPTDHLIWDYNLELIPKAWVKVHIKNINPFDEADKMVTGSITPSLTYFYGNKVDTIVKSWDSIGNDTMGIGYTVTKNEISTFKIKKVYLIGLDTVSCDLFY
jgi:hypothetical protein